MDTNTDAPSLGGVLKPLCRNAVRYLAGGLIALAVQKGLLDETTASVVAASPEYQAILAGAGIALAAAVEALWLRARKLGTPT